MDIDRSGATSWTDAEIAVLYDRVRPGYPPEAVAFALEPLRGRPDLRAVDVGAGTGKLTRQLCAAGVTTLAVEPAPGMRKVLKHTVSRAQVLAGSAEELPLPDASVDLVAVGQAFHWFDRDRAVPELARVLRPGGRMALFYNSRDASVDLVAVGQAFHWFDRDRAVPELARVLRPGGRLALFYNSRDASVAWVRALADVIGDHADHAGAHRERDPEVLGPFEPEAYGEFRHHHELDADGLADLVGSRSYAIRMPPADRAALLDRVRVLARTHPQLVGRQHFFMPYVAGVQRYRLRG